MSKNDQAALILVGATVVAILAGWYVLAGFLGLSIILIPANRN